MADRLSPLTNRVRRLLGTGDLHDNLTDHVVASNGSHTRGSTATLFEARLSKLSQVLEELRAVDLQREAELKALREQMALLREQNRRELLLAINAMVDELDAVIVMGRRMNHTSDETPRTPFERMCAQASARIDAGHQESLQMLLNNLAEVRRRLLALSEIGAHDTQGLRKS
ncbi:MAG: hypothetical protein HC822_10490 [Oscillochloris sp.]|nr:hypothetical protein [Oscillochloris sp.]